MTSPICHSSPTPTPIYGYDRISLWIDQPELPVSPNYFEQHCTNCVGTLKQMEFNARWKYRLDLFQPTITCLQKLLKVLGSEIAVLIVYVEFACDTLADNKEEAQHWQQQFLASAKLKSQRQSVATFKGTNYFGRRNGKSDQRRGHITVVYSDKPSKLNNAQPTSNAPPCLHIEHRVTGSEVLATRGIVSLQDLIQFDLPQFFDSYLRIYSLPTLTELGRLLAKIAGANTDVSKTALRKRANRWKAVHCNDVQFILHNALLATSKLTRHGNLATEPFSTWLKATILSSRSSLMDK